MQKITPFLWMNDNLPEAIEFYLSVFKNSRLVNRLAVGDRVQSATLELEGQEFMLLDGGPTYSFTPAISFFVKCETQEEIDYYWDNLIANGGEPSRCGWLKDRFGLSWQVVPNQLGRLLYQEDPAVAQRVMQALMGMQKIMISELEAAAETTTA